MPWPKGKPRSEATKRKIGASVKIACSRPEEKARRSAAVSGDKNPMKRPEVRAKISGDKNPMKRPEVAAKIAAFRLGRSRPDLMGDRNPMKRPEVRIKHLAAVPRGDDNGAKRPEARIKMSIARRGSKNHRWLGGISREPYAWEFNNELKEAIRKRDGYRCQLCGVSEMECRTRLPVHHIDYDKKNSDPVNLTALCGPCNSRVNKNRKHWTAFFQEKMIWRAIAKMSG